MRNIITCLLLTFCLHAGAQPLHISALPWAHFPPWQEGGGNPCLMIAPQPLAITVLTNSVSPFTLAGSSGTYLISTPPTNGYITNLNIVTGMVTYVETNSLATVDYFTYCTSNAPTCVMCAPAYINIVTPLQLTCGQCFNAPFLTGGVVTGDIFFNTGIADEQVCISYTNASCVNVTNCAQTDQYGNAKFFVHFCPGSSNYCIVQLATCQNLCYFNHVNVAGSGNDYPEGNGDYYLNSFSVTGGVLTEVLTNAAEGATFSYQSDGMAGGNPFCCSTTNFINAYCQIIANTSCLLYGSPTRVFNADCTSFGSNNTITGWVDMCGNAPSPLLVTFDSVNSVQYCTTNCP